MGTIRMGEALKDLEDLATMGLTDSIECVSVKALVTTLGDTTATETMDTEAMEVTIKIMG